MGGQGGNGQGVERPPTTDPLIEPPPNEKRRGRPKKTPEQREADALAQQRKEWQERGRANAPLWEEIVSIPFDMAADRRFPFWRLRDDEKKRIAVALSTVIEKRLPDFMLSWQEEIALGVMLGAAFITRYKQDAAERAKREQSDERRTRDSRDAQDRQNDSLETHLQSAAP